MSVPKAPFPNTSPHMFSRGILGSAAKTDTVPEGVTSRTLSPTGQQSAPPVSMMYRSPPNAPVGSKSRSRANGVATVANGRDVPEESTTTIAYAPVVTYRSSENLPPGPNMMAPGSDSPDAKRVRTPVVTSTVYTASSFQSPT